MRSGMLILGSFFVLLVAGKSEEIRTDDYVLRIENGALTRVEQLRGIFELDLSNLGITEIISGAFVNVTVKSLNLGFNKLSGLASNVFFGLGDGLETLNLGSNEIENMESPFVGLVNLKLLNFSDNPIRYLDGGTFAGIPRTADILLKRNGLFGFAANLFQDTDAGENFRVKRMMAIDSTEQSWQSDLRWSAGKTEVHGVRNVRDSEYDRYDDPLTIIVQDSVLEKVGLRPTDKENTNSKSSSEKSKKGYLDLGRFGIQSYAKGWYQLPDTYLTTLFLSGNAATEMSPEILNDLPVGVKRVFLSFNAIKMIKNDVMNNVHLEVLQFIGNRMETIEDRAFESLINLRELNLSDNKLKDFSFAASLSDSLSLLDLSMNRMLQIPHGAFSRLKNLTELSLRFNGISVIKSGFFEGLESLLRLELTGNQITEIESRVFVGIPKRELALDRNKISKISPTAFDIQDLINLKLDDNVITDFNEDTFRGLKGLKRLWLNSNKISEIRPGTMKHMNSLERLGISFNPIVKLRNGAFFGIPINSNTSIAIQGGGFEIMQGGIFEEVVIQTPTIIRRNYDTPESFWYVLCLITGKSFHEQCSRIIGSN